MKMEMGRGTYFHIAIVDWTLGRSEKSDGAEENKEAHRYQRRKEAIGIMTI
jgi:hypothetical protein